MSAYELGVFTNRLYNQVDMVNGNGNNSYFKYSDAELEAMKMKVPVMAGCSGKVTRIAVAVGDAVESGQVLVVIA